MVNRYCIINDLQLYVIETYRIAIGDTHAPHSQHAREIGASMNICLFFSDFNLSFILGSAHSVQYHEISRGGGGSLDAVKVTYGFQLPCQRSQARALDD